MGQRGPAPKPTSLKAAAGNPGKRALNDAEPLPPPGEISPPAWLGKRAQKIWAELAPVCVSMRTLTTADVYTFGRYCEAFARWLFLKQHFDKESDAAYFAATTYALKTDEGKTRYLMPLPQSVEMRQLHQQLKDLEDRFGLNASARSRIRIGISAAAPAPTQAAATSTTSGGGFAEMLRSKGVFQFPRSGA